MRARTAVLFVVGLAPGLIATLAVRAQDAPVTIPTDAQTTLDPEPAIDEPEPPPASPPPAPASAPTAPAAPASATATPAAPPPDTSGPELRPHIELFSEYRLTVTESPSGDSEWFHEVDVPRVHAGVDAWWSQASARLLLEATRSANAGALLGVAGDSLVVRLREAWLAWDVAGRGLVTGRAGIVPTFAINAIDRVFARRVVAASSLEETGLASPADLGVHAQLDIPRRFGRVSVGMLSGEGYASRERNRGKNVELAALVHPFAWLASMRPLGVLLAYTMGSSGTTSARADRLTAGLVWDASRIGGGATFTYAWGVEDSSERRAWLLEGFVRGEPISRLLLTARAFHHVRDTRVEGDVLTRVTGAVGWRVVKSLETHVVVERTIPGAAARAALPGSDEWRVRAVARVVF